MHHTELASRRRSLGLTQAELAARLDVHPNTIAQWERGDRPITRPNILRLALQALEDEMGQVPYEEQLRCNQLSRAEMEREIAKEERTPSPERDAGERWFGKH